MLLPPLPETRWTIDRDGIVWNVAPNAAPHEDHIETSGERCSLVLTYGTGESGALIQKPHVVWPMLRIIPNDTYGNLQFAFEPDHLPTLVADGQPVSEKLKQARLDGRIHFESQASGLTIRRSWFAARTLPMAVERLTIKNEGSRPIRLALLPAKKIHTTDPAKALDGAYTVEAVPWLGEESELAPGKSREMAIYFTARSAKAKLSLPRSPGSEEERRERQVKSLDTNLALKTPDPTVDQMFRFAKIRAAESLFRTKNGLVHSPGGRSYYAAIWANDQAEYANPLFGYLGYPQAYEASETSFDWFARYMNPEFKPIPSSIIAEGTDFWNGAGDRGDMAMIAYGASSYALARGDQGKAKKLWPLIEWCLDYLERKKTTEGIIASDSDELEGRFPAGKANLNTSGLAYDALLSSASLAEDLGHPEKGKLYRERAVALRKAIEAYFGRTVEGFETYRYYEGNDVLRAWIATPLTVGITDRAEGTLDALFSPRLWTSDGLASLAGDATFWDRATLYGFRGAFATGYVDRAWSRFEAYTQRRLLGEHVPYAVEAYPEGNQRHLSAESALYVRAVTEGLFGLRPTGLKSFEVNPHLPKEWEEKGMTLSRIHIAGSVVNVKADRDGCVVSVAGRKAQRFPLGKPIHIDLSAGE
ncbi:hypothetical protein EON81_16710 [bacterium]|nr:MAG: hypothetical protein EON81_16710 [bacterium]